MLKRENVVFVLVALLLGMNLMRPAGPAPAQERTPAAGTVAGEAAGKPYIVQISASSVGSGSTNGPHVALFRLWSDGSVDTVYVQNFSMMDCTPFDDLSSGLKPCWKGFIPPNPPFDADLTYDGTVDGADLGLLLAAWTQSSAR